MQRRPLARRGAVKFDPRLAHPPCCWTLLSWAPNIFRSQISEGKGEGLHFLLLDGYFLSFPFWLFFFTSDCVCVCGRETT